MTYTNIKNMIWVRLGTNKLADIYKCITVDSSSETQINQV